VNPKSQKALATVSLILASVAAGACRQKTAIWIEHGSTAAHLVFGISKTPYGNESIAMGVLRVERCSPTSKGYGEPMWVVGPRAGTADIRRIVYGQTPPDFVSDVGPRPLGPGCYRALISGTGEAEFVVGEDSSVVEHSSSVTD
jgi:hypothetical protein